MTGLPSRAVRWGRGAVLPALLLAAWWLSAAPDKGRIAPTPEGVISALAKILADGSLWRDLLISLSRNLTGLILGGIVGLTIGVVIGMNRLSARLFIPTLDMVKLISPFAWIPLIMTWLGLGEESKIAFIALVAFLPVTFSTIEALAATPRTLIELGHVHRFSRFQFLAYLALPSAMPGILSGTYLAIVASWMATLGAEYMLTSGGGIGAALVTARDNFATDELIVLVATIGLIGVAYHFVFKFVEAEALHWRRTIATNAA